jgi:hypothetical protein
VTFRKAKIDSEFSFCARWKLGKGKESFVVNLSRQQVEVNWGLSSSIIHRLSVNKGSASPLDVDIVEPFKANFPKRQALDKGNSTVALSMAEDFHGEKRCHGCRCKAQNIFSTSLHN